ncbi:hypothetical protein GCM10011502_16910 [Oceanisphaera marina]|uniref:Structural protein MipA n=1 Tax=Oceanisphaera marina TaxID=2017550 RepID=A0ABQ1IJL6_9GAMM|nr:MipA/OmpV family protein [Oceanisphaera marina]GGB44224.1 hypothetical protein GCM10011502_16910 [Oceanisphaera marina]
MSRSFIYSLAALAPMLAAPAMAQSPWSGTLGAAVMVTPDYLGSDDYTSRVLPDLNVKYGELFYLNLRDGLGWNLYQQQDWSLSPFIGYHLGRDNTGDLSGFEKIDAGLTGGVRLSYQPGAWNYSLKAETPLGGDVEGYKVTLRAGWRSEIAPNWYAGFGPSLIYSSKEWTQDMFDVSARDAARSGLSRYRADQGYWRLGLTGSMTYRFASDWSVTGLAGITQLSGDAKDSPIVSQVGDATQTLTGVVLSYHF